MRQKRTKAYKKLMSLYSLSFGFRQPYQVLVDSGMCTLAVTAKTDLPRQLSTVLQGTVKPMITQCCIHELYLQGASQQPVADLAKSFERRKCNHREAIPGDQCIASVIGKPLLLGGCIGIDSFAGDANQHRYVVAIQSRPLRVKLRLVPAVPIVHVNRAVMILEPPSDATVKLKEENEEKAFQPSVAEMANIRSATPVDRSRKNRGPKGPNPLSVKKKATPPVQRRMPAFGTTDPAIIQKRKSSEVDGTVRKRKRRRKHSSVTEATKPVV